MSSLDQFSLQHDLRRLYFGTTEPKIAYRADMFIHHHNTSSTLFIDSIYNKPPEVSYQGLVTDLLSRKKFQIFLILRIQVIIPNICTPKKAEFVRKVTLKRI